MQIRKAQIEDIPSILDIYSVAKSYMREHGNPNQWSASYPSEREISSDIERSMLYVVVDDNKPCAVFVFTLNEETAYRKIDGEWSYNEYYGTVHRIASNGRRKGILQFVIDYVLHFVPYIRIDTHRDNKTMRHALLSYGFKECGTVYYERGGERTERIAFDYRKES